METNLNCARRTHKLKLSTLHKINSLKISQACNSLDNFSVGDVCCGSASHTHNCLAVRANNLAQESPVPMSFHQHKQIRINKDAQQISFAVPVPAFGKGTQTKFIDLCIRGRQLVCPRDQVVAVSHSVYKR